MLKSFTTDQDSYATVKKLANGGFYNQDFGLQCGGHSLKVTILGDSYGDKSFATTVVVEFTVAKDAPALVKSITYSYAAFRIMVKPAVAGQNGTLQTCVTFTDVPFES